MDLALAKEFVFLDSYSFTRTNKIYISKTLEPLLKLSDNSLISIYGVVDTEAGEVLMSMDWSFSGEPLLMRRFLHKKYFLDHYWNREIVIL